MYFFIHLRYLPNGSETGRFLALDLGGTNFRVLLVDIGEDMRFNMESKIFPIPKEIMTRLILHFQLKTIKIHLVFNAYSTGVELFDHIASCLVEFVDEQNLHDETLPLGFTFSFPCQQEGLTKVSLKIFHFQYLSRTTALNLWKHFAWLMFT